LPEIEVLSQESRIQTMLPLIDSELRYRRLFEAAQDGILILDANTGMIEDVNPFLIEMLGYSREEFIKKKLWDVGAFKDNKANQEAFEALQENEYIRYEDLPLRARSGKLIQVEFVSNVYLVGHEKVIQCNIRDITGRKDAENEAQKAHAELLVLVAELQRRDGEMKRLIHMDDLLQSCTSVAEAFQVISIMARDLFSSQNGSLAILNTHSQLLETVARWGEAPVIASEFLLKDCWAMRRGQPHEVVDPNKGLLCQHYIQTPETGTLCLPLIIQGETLGLLSIIGDMQGEQANSLRQLGVAVGEAISLSLSNIKLREELLEQAIRDPLTGLYNRRYLEESLSHELYRSKRLKTQLCVAMLDLDDFKLVNDIYGHGAGDAVLSKIGRILLEHLRSSDITCRYGGDEFLLVMPDSSPDDAHQRLEEIRLLIKGQAIHYGGKALTPMTVSIGIAAANEHRFIARELIRAADDALYAAKQVGSDQILVDSGINK
jgi:diguanylate cyclase (GGDEF)-like protein/PAS domain S-box-containing protein